MICEISSKFNFWTKIGLLTQCVIDLKMCFVPAHYFSFNWPRFSSNFQPFNNWLDGTREDLVDMFIVHTLDEIQGLIDAHAQFKATLGEADKEFQAIIALIHEVEGFAKQYNVPGANINPYTNLTGSVRLFNV